MNIGRRQTIKLAAATVITATLPACATNIGESTMYGLISKMIAVDGMRNELINILINGISGMPGCKSYIVAEDVENSNAIWITEVWTDKQKHTESLTLPSVQNAIKLGKPLIAGFGERIETTPIGGQGI